MPKINPPPITSSLDATATPFEIGQAAGRAALAGLNRIGPLTAEQTEWLSGFLQAFLNSQRTVTEAPTTSAVVQPERTNSGEPHGLASAECSPYTARIAKVEPYLTSDGETLLSVTLDVEGGQLRYRPGSTLNLWPTNDPEEVRKILRALGVSAQLQVPTIRGAEPAWQVLLERVNIAILSPQTLEFLADYSKSESEGSSLRSLSEAGQAQLQSRTLLSLLRRFPSTRPPLDRLLSNLAPLEPAQLPIASSFIDTPNWLQFSARLVDSPKGWGELGSSAKLRFRVGEWVTVSIDTDSAPLPIDDDLSPVVVIADGECLSVARALAAERRALRAKGRNCVIGFGIDSSTCPYARDLMAWHKIGSIVRHDISTGSEPREVRLLLESNEETLWRWLVDRSQICLISPNPRMRSTVSDWLIEVISRRQKLDAKGAKSRLDELRTTQRFIERPA